MLDRQGLLKGDLNVVQQLGLMWTISNENEEKIDLEKLRAVNTGLATNPATAKDFIMNMLKEEPKEVIEEQAEFTPRSAQEIEEFLRVNALSIPQET